MAGTLFWIDAVQVFIAAEDHPASYNPDSGKIALALHDGRTLSLTAGQHIEEAEEW